MGNHLSYLLIAWLLACFAGVGCSARIPWMTEKDFQDCQKQVSTSLEETRDAVPVSAPVSNLLPSAVRTVMDPEAPQRPISLEECIALALENGRLGTNAIRVLAYDPAIAATDIEQSLSKFDAQWKSSMSWDNVDEPVGTASQVSLGSSSVLEENNATFSSALYKLLPTGGVAGITFSTPYQLSNEDADVNPAYQPVLTFSFEQPLLRGWGVRINQLRESHPGSVSTSLETGDKVSGILITRVNLDRVQAQFTNQVQELLFDVERAYWNLHLAYWNLYTQETALMQMHAAWQQAKKRFDASQLTVQDLAQLEEQYQVFRGQRLEALGDSSGRAGVLEAERQLRLVVGLPLEDGTRLVPLDNPTVSPFRADWFTSANEALFHRPDLRQAADTVRRATMTLEREENDILPDLRFTSSYNSNAVGSQLDGPGSPNALRNLADNKFNNWSLGLQCTVLIGRRAAHARVRKAELELARSNAELRNRQEQAVFDLGRSYRRLYQCQEDMRIQSARRQAGARQLQARQVEFRSGQGLIINLVEAQRTFVNAQLAERSSIVTYNIALADFERQKGTLLESDNVAIAEGPLPTCVQERASAHIRERQQAFLLRTQALSPASDFPVDMGQSEVSLPEVLQHRPERLPNHLGEEMR